MAGGKQSPRQKLVSLMYLVFLAMMAMSMDKAVLSAFGSLKETLEKNNKQASEKNTSAYTDLATKASEQSDKYGPKKAIADKVKKLSSDLNSFIEDLKTTALGQNKPDAYEKMDKGDFLDEYFFQGDNFTANGKEFVEKIKNYREKVKSLMNKDTKFVKELELLFNTDPVLSKDKVTKKKWLQYHYEGFPLVASLTKLSQLQSNIKATETSLLNSLVGDQMKSDASLTNFEAMVVFNKNAYYPGEKLSGRIVLGKNDPTLKAKKVVINGVSWPESKIKAGQVVIDGPAGNVGDKELKGQFTFLEDGKEVNIPIKGGYSVIPRPNDAVISADKMNVVYKGLSNPLTISIPGIAANKISASAPGLKKTKGDKYVMRPTGKGFVNIVVTGTLPDGKKVSSKKKFRVKEIPPAVAMVRKQYDMVSMPKRSVAGLTVGAGLPDFLFDLKLNVSSFKIKVPGQVAIPVSGTRMNSRAKAAIAKCRRNQQIVIYDVKATVSGSNYKIKKVLPVVIKVSN